MWGEAYNSYLKQDDHGRGVLQYIIIILLLINLVEHMRGSDIVLPPCMFS